MIHVFLYKSRSELRDKKVQGFNRSVFGLLWEWYRHEKLSEKSCQNFLWITHRIPCIEQCYYIPEQVLAFGRQCNLICWNKMLVCNYSMSSIHMLSDLFTLNVDRSILAHIIHEGPFITFLLKCIYIYWIVMIVHLYSNSYFNCS